MSPILTATVGGISPSKPSNYPECSGCLSVSISAVIGGAQLAQVGMEWHGWLDGNLSMHVPTCIRDTQSQPARHAPPAPT